jgi:folate/biopterin transporter
LEKKYLLNKIDPDKSINILERLLQYFVRSIKSKLVDLDVNYWVIILVAFSQGITGLSDLAINYLYKDDLKLEPSEVSRINSIASLPWIVKPIYGLISDSFPILGFRRKPYLLIFGVCSTICWILMSIWVDSITKALLIVLVNQTCIAFCNVIGEALVVETSQKQKANDPDAGAKNVSLYFFTKSTGSLLTAFSSGALLEYMDKRKVFFITASFPLMIVLSALLLQEKKINSKNDEQISGIIIESDYDTIKSERPSVNRKPNISDQLSLFWTFLKMDIIFKPVIFIFCYSMTPSYTDPLFYFYTSVLRFSPIVMGRLRLIYGIATVAGIIIYNNYLKNISFKKIMWSTTLLSIFFNMLSIVVTSRFNLKLGIPDFWFCLTADALTMALAEINTLPLLILACNICPKNIEGTLYAFLMSVYNLGSMVSNQFGAFLTISLGITNSNFENLSWLIFIANIFLLLPMPSLYLIDDSAYNVKEKEKKEDISDLDFLAEFESKQLIISQNKKDCNVEYDLKAKQSDKIDL